MQKIASGWNRDLRPQSELIQASTLSAEEELHARRFERKISKLTERQTKLRSAIKVDHVQLEALENEIYTLSNKAVLKRIAAGFRRCVLDSDVARPAAPAKRHSSLVKSEVQLTVPAASQSLERFTEAVVVRETTAAADSVSRDADEIDSASEVSTVDTIDATQVAAIEKAALLLKAAGLPGLTAEQLRAFAAQPSAA